ncbi:MAG TPA: Ig-like domain-containing protein, partial [Candidatus Paceibacterota bacterium]|nr:Ig-like domain-containing protein [Candidatus Paceibacterota bacterium]
MKKLHRHLLTRVPWYASWHKNPHHRVVHYSVAALFTIAMIGVLVFSSTTHAAGTIYYVAANGSDANSGTSPSAPWQTLTKVNSTSFAPGDQILFNRGDTFYGFFVPKNSGTSSAPITYGAYGSGNKPVITGLTSVSGWTNTGGNIWESAPIANGLSKEEMMVTINGTLYPMGRYPNANASNGGYLTYESSSGNNQITDTTTPSQSWVGADLVVRKYRWSTDRGPITSQSGGTFTFTPLNSQYQFSNGFGYFIENSLATLDQQNEWYYNPSTKKLDIYSTSMPTNVQAATVDTLIPLTSTISYVNFENLSLRGSNAYGFYSPFSHIVNVNISNCDVSFSGINGIEVEGGTNVSVDSCNVSFSNNNGIDMAGGDTNVSVTNNTITNSGFYPGMTTPKEYTSGLGISLGGSNNTAKNNQVANSGYSGVTFNGTNTIIQNNYIHDFCLIKDDCGGVYFDAGTYTGSKVLGNIIINGIGAPLGTTSSDYLAEGIYADDGTSQVEIGGNTVASIGHAAIFNHGAHDLNIHDNTFYDAPVISGYYNEINSSANITQVNNIFLAKTASQLVLRSTGGSTSQGNFFTTSDNNYWARPMNDISDFSVVDPSVGVYDLTGWKALTGKEVHSKASPVSITNANQIFFDYNPSNSPKVDTLSGNYVDIKGAPISGSVTIPAWGSVILFQGSSTSSAPVVTLYKDCNYGGTPTSLPAGTYTLAQLQAAGILNNDVSSIFIASGYRTTLYDGDNFTGSSLALTSSVSCLIDKSFNDLTTSLAIASTAPTDTTPPSVSLTTPIGASTVSNTITITATATDNVSVDHVDFYKDSDATPFFSDTSSPYTTSFDTTTLTNGTHTFKAKAFDAAGNSATSTAVSVTVSNVITPPPDTTAPSVSLTAPTSGATLSGTTTLSASATDNVGVDHVDFYLGSFV